MAKYSVADIVKRGGKVYTKDKKYFLQSDRAYPDSGYDYWHEVIGVERGIHKLSSGMGHYSYDYCFRKDLVGCVDRLNKILERKHNV